MAIQFSCPHCGKLAVASDEYAGQTGPCAGCGKPVTIPASSSVPQYGPPPTRSKGGGSSVLMIVGAVIGIVALLCAGIGAAIILPALGGARESARRMQSMNNLKRLAIAVHEFEATHGHLPPAVVTDAKGQPLYSGRVLLLPYLDQRALFDQFDKTQPWDSPKNKPLSDLALKFFQDPSNQSKNQSRADYVFVTGKGTMFEAGRKLRISEVLDGTSNTMMLIETSAGPASWAEPVDWNADSGQLPPSVRTGLVLYALGDGSTRTSRRNEVQGIVPALVGRDDGLPVPLP